MTNSQEIILSSQQLSKKVGREKAIARTPLVDHNNVSIFDSSSTNSSPTSLKNDQFELSPTENFYFTPKSLKELRKAELLEKLRNSPSAAGQIRLRQLIEQPTQQEPDIYRDEFNHITSQEVNLAKQNLTVAEIFAGVKLFVDIRQDRDNRSKGVQGVLRRRGITVTDNIDEANYVIFKNGLKTTFKRATEKGLPLVQLQWIDACDLHKILLDPADYKASNLDKYENPESLKKMRRRKSFQPCTSQLTVETKKQRRRRPQNDAATPTAVDTTPQDTTDRRKTINTPKTIEITVTKSASLKTKTQVYHNGTKIFASESMLIEDQNSNRKLLNYNLFIIIKTIYKF